ncbi:MAG: ATP-dependent helicase [Chloroflexi bacterium]|nr:MAG: ATP-dependent helicase [Chloroflexota bacterium]
MNAAVQLRPAQARILDYEGGCMGVSAVPGSGKTFTLSLLAARLVERVIAHESLDDREVLVVTFTNSAVENFRSRIAHFLNRERGLLPGVGYRVRTLHALAHDIVRERPALVGLHEGFGIVDERTSAEIIREAVQGYLRTHPDIFGSFILPDYLQRARTIERYIQDDALEIANAVIRVGKDLRVEPYELQARLRRQSGTWPLLEFGIHIYADYQRSLQTRGAVDFNDLIVLALRALDADPNYLDRLQERWPYVLEDEAQDSTALQEAMLRRLTARRGNWVRVGDPNQAITTTFTSANPEFLVAFTQKHSEQARDLPNSGRSARPIIEVANHLIEWSRTRHPVLPQRLALTPPRIEPTLAGDPQPNPDAGQVPHHFFERAMTPEQEIEIVVSSLRRWLPDHLDATVAVLTLEGGRCFHITEALEAAGLPFDDSLLRTSTATRAAAQALATVLDYIAQPAVGSRLEQVWSEVWWPRRGPSLLAQRAHAAAPVLTPAAVGETLHHVVPATRKQDLPEPVKTFAAALRKLDTPESFLFPAGHDWLNQIGWLDSVDGLRAVVEAFRSDLQRWTRATVLPADELVLTLGNDLFVDPADLALAHFLAVHLAKLAAENPTYRLPDLAGELGNIATNRKRMPGFDEDTQGYEPKRGKVTVATMHAAKGLEWDRVYLISVNNYNFPSGAPDDAYRGERWFTRDRLNLMAEALAQVRQLHMGTLDDYVPGEATRQARLEVAAERLRLLYVGITRARRELIVTYNTGRRENNPSAPAAAFEALQRFCAQAR